MLRRMTLSHTGKDCSDRYYAVLRYHHAKLKRLKTYCYGELLAPLAVGGQQEVEVLLGAAAGDP